MFPYPCDADKANIKFQFESMSETFQDDGFGNWIDTNEVCDNFTNELVVAMVVNSYWDEPAKHI